MTTDDWEAERTFEWERQSISASVSHRPLRADEWAVLIERAATRPSEGSLLDFAAFVRFEVESMVPHERELIQGILRAADATAISKEESFMLFDSAYDFGLRSKVHQHRDVVAIGEVLRDTDSGGDAADVWGDPWFVSPAWIELDRRLQRCVEIACDEVWHELGAYTYAAALRDDPASVGSMIHRAHANLVRTLGLTGSKLSRDLLPRPWTGLRVVDDEFIMHYHRPTAAECLTLLQSSVTGRTHTTLGEILDGAHAYAKSQRQALRWVAAARRAREVQILAPEVSFVFIDAMIDVAFGDELADDEISCAITRDQDEILKRHGIDEVRDADPTWYAPEEWWTLDRRWHARRDMLECGILRRLGEDDLAILIETEGGQRVATRLAHVEGAMPHG